MKKLKILLVLNFICWSGMLLSQLNPVWDIGTKWTYEFKPDINITSFVTNEIIDTVNIDGLHLYKVISFPEFTGIRYFHYQNDKVYNYDPNNKILQLLYDFNNEEEYLTKYRPICDPAFDYDSLTYQSYVITIDSIVDFQMPDGSLRKVQDTSNEVNRRVLTDIGFLEGYIHHTHDWELGMHICDEFANYVLDLRCFENDSVQYNFKDYPCDSMWILSQTKELDEISKIEIFPNPSYGQISIKSEQDEVEFEIYNLKGQKIQEGFSRNQNIDLIYPGLNMIRVKTKKDQWNYYKIINLGNAN